RDPRQLAADWPRQFLRFSVGPGYTLSPHFAPRRGPNEISWCKRLGRIAFTKTSKLYRAVVARPLLVLARRGGGLQRHRGLAGGGQLLVEGGERAGLDALEAGQHRLQLLVQLVENGVGLVGGAGVVAAL